jgi:hypothetical protein
LCLQVPPVPELPSLLLQQLLLLFARLQRQQLTVWWAGPCQQQQAQGPCRSGTM